MLGVYSSRHYRSDSLFVDWVNKSEAIFLFLRLGLAAASSVVLLVVVFRLQLSLCFRRRSRTIAYIACVYSIGYSCVIIVESSSAVDYVEQTDRPIGC